MNDIGARIKYLREQKGLSQDELGIKIGLKKSTISLNESGRNAVQESTVLAICREFGVSYDWLRTGVGEMFETETDDALDAILDPMLLHEKETAKAVIKALAKMGGDEWKMFRKFILDTAHEIEQTEHRQE